ncbi:MAG: hypothetical protein GC154_16645 [bacterium]|nr:hypothetical protein [bacterium]
MIFTRVTRADSLSDHVLKEEYSKMVRLSPSGTLIFLSCSSLFVLFAFLMDQGELQHVPKYVYQIYFVALGFIFCWWPIDLLLHWEKRTIAAETKDNWVSGAALAIVCFIVPYFILETPFWPTLIIALCAGLVIPGSVTLRHWRAKTETRVDPHYIQRIALESERAKEFQRYFPNAAQYVTGMNAADGNRAHLLIHDRKPCAEAPGYHIDYVMDISVDREVGIYIGGKERLHCYLFRNDGERAYIGMLPSANIGRSLDYGFSDEEIERAIEEAGNPDQQWAALDEQPLMVRYYSGKAAKVH